MDKNFTQPSYLCIAEIFSGMILYFYPCGEDHHRPYIIINMGQKNCRIKVSPVGARDEKAKIFSRQRFPAIHMVLLFTMRQLMGAIRIFIIPEDSDCPHSMLHSLEWFIGIVRKRWCLNHEAKLIGLNAASSVHF